MANVAAVTGQFAEIASHFTTTHFRRMAPWWVLTAERFTQHDLESGRFIHCDPGSARLIHHDPGSASFIQNDEESFPRGDREPVKRNIFPLILKSRDCRHGHAAALPVQSESLPVGLQRA